MTSETNARERIRAGLERIRQYHRTRIEEIECVQTETISVYGERGRDTLGYQGRQVVIATHRLVLAYLGDADDDG